LKLTSTLKFFAVVVALLALLCVVFPSDGIHVGEKTIRFPKLHSVLVREKQKDINELLVKEEERDISGIVDSIADCYRTIYSSQLRFWLPNDDYTFFDRFFSAAESAARNRRIVRMVHYGDSQIEMDRITCRIRERMQEVFGGGGPGMLPLRQPVPTYTFNQFASGPIVGQSTWGDSNFVHNDNYGPMLRSWRVNGSATMSLSASKGLYATERVSHFSSIRVVFNNRPGPISISMRDRKGGGSFSESVSEQGVGMISWQLDSATTSAHLSLQGNSDIYCVLVDNGYGVAVDNVGMRSVSGHQFRKVKFNQLADAYKLMDIGLIIMQFGGNSVPYLRTDKTIDDYCIQMGNQIDYVRRACPEATILFIGPSDMSTTVNGRRATYPKLPTIVERLRQMANEHGAADWSIYHAMGGEQSMVSWNASGLAGSDFVHFSAKGAAIMGDYFSDALLKLYQLYLIRKQFKPEKFEQLWSQVKSQNAL